MKKSGIIALALLLCFSALFWVGGCPKSGEAGTETETETEKKEPSLSDEDFLYWSSTWEERYPDPPDLLDLYLPGCRDSFDYQEQVFRWDSDLKVLSFIFQSSNPVEEVADDYRQDLALERFLVESRAGNAVEFDFINVDGVPIRISMMPGESPDGMTTVTVTVNPDAFKQKTEP